MTNPVVLLKIQGVRSAACAAAAIFFVGLHADSAVAQQAAGQASIDDLQEVVIVGSQIKGKISAAVPVTLITDADIQAVGAVSGDELFRSVPQFGDVNFNASNSAQTTNAARGDVGSADLRTLGIGNTLVLINGRRNVTHPTSQALTNTNSVPVLTISTFISQLSLPLFLLFSLLSFSPPPWQLSSPRVRPLP